MTAVMVDDTAINIHAEAAMGAHETRRRQRGEDSSIALTEDKAISDADTRCDSPVTDRNGRVLSWTGGKLALLHV